MIGLKMTWYIFITHLFANMIPISIFQCISYNKFLTDGVSLQRPHGLILRVHSSGSSWCKNMTYAQFVYTFDLQFILQSLYLNSYFYLFTIKCFFFSFLSLFLIIFLVCFFTIPHSFRTICIFHFGFCKFFFNLNSLFETITNTCNLKLLLVK